MKRLGAFGGGWEGEVCGQTPGFELNLAPCPPCPQLSICKSSLGSHESTDETARRGRGNCPRLSAWPPAYLQHPVLVAVTAVWLLLIILFHSELFSFIYFSFILYSRRDDRLLLCFHLMHSQAKVQENWVMVCHGACWKPSDLHRWLVFQWVFPEHWGFRMLSSQRPDVCSNSSQRPERQAPLTTQVGEVAWKWMTLLGPGP